MEGKITKSLLCKIDGNSLKLGPCLIGPSVEVYELLHSKLLGKATNVKAIKITWKKDTTPQVTDFNFCKRFGQVL